MNHPMSGAAGRYNPRQRVREIEGFVGHALDDLECERLAVVDALRLVADLAWDSGYRHGFNAASGRGRPSPQVEDEQSGAERPGQEPE
jgi:hypothetical protein